MQKDVVALTRAQKVACLDVQERSRALGKTTRLYSTNLSTFCIR